MINSFHENCRDLAIDFLQQNSQQRLTILQQLGIARYDFLTKISFNENNIICIMRFLQSPNQLKFPNLTGADLSGLNLENVNLIRGNLSGANLQGSSLVNADLLFVNFTQANLKDADLRGATLNQTIWLNTIVENCNLGLGVGLTQIQCQDLQLQGAVFDEELKIRN